MKQRSLFNKPIAKDAVQSDGLTKVNINTPKVANNLTQVKSRNYDPVYCKIQQRRLQMLIHSCIYYELNDSIVLDSAFDAWARELVTLQSSNPEISKQVPWYEAFKDWDGTTGYHLPTRHPWVMSRAIALIDNMRRENY